MERKRASFAGSWYPGRADACEAAIHRYLLDKEGVLSGSFTGGVVPHAGWSYSGSIACRVIASLKDDAVRTVAVFGMHMHPSSEPCILAGGSWETPFGDLGVNRAFSEAVAGKVVLRSDTAATFPEENTIELQLPFIKYFFPKAAIAAMGVPPSARTAVALGEAVAETAREQGEPVVVVGSTDLTHYGPNYGFSPAGSGEKAHEWVRQENDRKAVEALLAMDSAGIVGQGLTRQNLCCAGAAAAAAAAAKKMGATRGRSVDYATSYETSPGSSFVGYAGVLFERAG